MASGGQNFETKARKPAVKPHGGIKSPRGHWQRKTDQS
jgi:hypothetical protein